MLSTRTTKKYKPLNKKHRAALLHLISVACKIFESDKSMRSAAERIIKLACWRWTADAVDPMDDSVKRDAIKFDPQHLLYSKKAAAHFSRQNPKKYLTHEHAVPLKCLAERILELGSEEAPTIQKLMARYCRATLITREENGILNRSGYKQKMPDGWKWRDSPFARYRTCRITLQP